MFNGEIDFLVGELQKNGVRIERMAMEASAAFMAMSRRIRPNTQDRQPSLTARKTLPGCRRIANRFISLAS
jgi:hypothetical protein